MKPRAPFAVEHALRASYGALVALLVRSWRASRHIVPARVRDNDAFRAIALGRRGGRDVWAS